jgi:hypothetical protein
MHRVVAGLTVLAAAGVIAASAAGAGSPPVAPTFLGATAANQGLAVRPPAITYTGDGSGFIGGASSRNPKSKIHWRKWTSKRAIGIGYNQLNDCQPSCADGTYHGYRVRIALWRSRTVRGVLVFTRMTIFYVKGRPRGEPRHYTFTDLYTSSPPGFGWGPPSEQGYCTHTLGLKPAAGCRNIHSLP